MHPRRDLRFALVLLAGVVLCGCGGGAARVIGSGARTTTTVPSTSLPAPVTTATTVTSAPVATTAPSAPSTPVGPALTAQITAELNALTTSLAQAQSDLATSAKTSTGG